MLVDRAGSVVFEELIVNRKAEDTSESIQFVQKYLQVRLVRCPFK
jgi:hypothetical protein